MRIDHFWDTTHSCAHWQTSGRHGFDQTDRRALVQGAQNKKIRQVHIVCSIALSAQPKDAVTQGRLDSFSDRIRYGGRSCLG